jgi:hypothetical protein
MSLREQKTAGSRRKEAAVLIGKIAPKGPRNKTRARLENLLASQADPSSVRAPRRLRASLPKGQGGFFVSGNFRGSEKTGANLQRANFQCPRSISSLKKDAGRLR